MAPLTRSEFFVLPELALEAPRVESKDIQATSYPISLAHPQVPRLVTYKSKSGTCSSCSKSSNKSCSDCRGMVFYCNADCQIAHWPKHKDMCQDLEDQHLLEVMEARDTAALNQITSDLGKIISSDFKSLGYNNDPNLSVKIDDSASFGDLYDISEGSECTMRSFYPGTYKCTSVTPDESCTPLTIYHHESVDPTRIMKQCILMSQDLYEQTDLTNQVMMPQWCNWEGADKEYIPSDSESEASEMSESDLYFSDFVDKVLEDKPQIESDLEDQEYDPSESESENESDESDVSDHEVDYLIAESKIYIRDVPQKRQIISTGEDMEVAETGDSETNDSEAEEYNEFKVKVLESEHKYAFDESESDYLPYSDSDSDSGESIPEREMSDSEKYISENELEDLLESSKDLRDLDDDMYDEFVDNVFDRDHIEESDADDEDYAPAEVDSDSSSEEDEISDHEEKDLLEDSQDLIHNLSGKRQCFQTEFYSSESDSDSEVSSEGELYEDFIIHTESKYNLSDTEDVEYNPVQSDSESSCSSSEYEMEISDAESDAIVNDSKDEVKQVSGQKRKCSPSEDVDSHDSDSDNEVEMESDDELYNQFRLKMIVSDPSKVEDIGGSDDEEFVPSAESEDESQDESQDDSQDEESQGSEKSDDEMDVTADEINELIELSSEEELYEEFKDEVCKTERKMKTQKTKSPLSPCNNKDIIYFMNSQYASSIKDALDSGKIEKGSKIPGSFTLKNGSESSGVAVEMKGQSWRSAHAFEDSTSGKCFALVVSTDTWDHLSINHEHLQAHYPNQKWSSTVESGLKFQMSEFVY